MEHTIHFFKISRDKIKNLQHNLSIILFANKQRKKQMETK